MHPVHEGGAHGRIPLYCLELLRAYLRISRGLRTPMGKKRNPFAYSNQTSDAICFPIHTFVALQNDNMICIIRAPLPALCCVVTYFFVSLWDTMSDDSDDAPEVVSFSAAKKVVKHGDSATTKAISADRLAKKEKAKEKSAQKLQEQEVHAGRKRARSEIKQHTSAISSLLGAPLSLPADTLKHLTFTDAKSKAQNVEHDEDHDATIATRTKHTARASAQITRIPTYLDT